MVLRLAGEDDDDVTLIHAQLPLGTKVLRRLHFGGNHLRHKVLQSFERRTVLKGQAKSGGGQKTTGGHG